MTLFHSYICRNAHIILFLRMIRAFINYLKLLFFVPRRSGRTGALNERY